MLQSIQQSINLSKLMIGYVKLQNVVINNFHQVCLSWMSITVFKRILTRNTLSYFVPSVVLEKGHYIRLICSLTSLGSGRENIQPQTIVRTKKWCLYFTPINLLFRITAQNPEKLRSNSISGVDFFVIVMSFLQDNKLRTRSFYDLWFQ